MSNYKKAYRLYPHSKNLLRTPAMVGGREKGDYFRVQLLVDTGASFTILPVQALKALGYEMNHPLRYQKIVTGSGMIDAPVVIVSWFNCLGQTIKNFDFEVVAYKIPGSLEIGGGLLGMDFLTRFQAIISVREPEIRY